MIIEGKEKTHKKKTEPKASVINKGPEQQRDVRNPPRIQTPSKLQLRSH